MGSRARRRKKRAELRGRGLVILKCNKSSKFAQDNMVRTENDRKECVKKQPTYRNKLYRGKCSCIWVTNLLIDKSFKLDYDPIDSVRKVKTRIEYITGIPWQQQTLLLSGQHAVDDTDMMSEIEMRRNKWKMSVGAHRDFQYVIVYDKSDNTEFVQEVDFNARASRLYDIIPANAFEKKMLAEKGNCARLLFYFSRVLEPEKTLKSYSMAKGVRVTLLRFEDSFPRRVYVSIAGRNIVGELRVGPLMCEPKTTVYDLKSWFVDITKAPIADYAMFFGPEMVPNHLRMGEIDVPHGTVFRIIMNEDPLGVLQPPNQKRMKLAEYKKYKKGLKDNYDYLFKDLVIPGPNSGPNPPCTQDFLNDVEEETTR